MSVLKGSGKLEATLSASAYTIKVSKLPERVTLSVAVTDPDGRPLEGARVTFTLGRAGRPGCDLEADPDRGRRLGWLVDDDPQGRDDRPGSCTVIVQTIAIRERDRPDRHHHREVAPASNPRAKLAALMPQRDSAGRS